MARNILVIGAAFFFSASVFGSAAQACISCNYVPEVVNTPVRGQAGLGASKKQRAYAANAKKERAARKPATQMAKADPAPKKVVVAKAEPAKTVEPAVNATKDAAASAPLETAKEAREVPVSVASVINRKELALNDVTEETAAVADVGCKKFFPAVGMTLTVPCE